MEAKAVRNTTGDHIRKQTGFACGLLLAALLAGCGNVGSTSDVKLGVPYRAQAPGSFDCGPASVLMWRLYDGLSEVSQSTIGNWMGGTCSGVSQDGIADAVNFWTHTHDAYWDFVGEDEQDSYFSRQITSIDTGSPVIAIISFNHAGVINGGKWHQLSGGGYQWDYVYFHDPQTFANDYYSADHWIDSNCPPGSPCEQIISVSASGAFAQNLSTYGDDIGVRGIERDREPIEY
jgi:hypothetical protein